SYLFNGIYFSDHKLVCPSLRDELASNAVSLVQASDDRITFPVRVVQRLELLHDPLLFYFSCCHNTPCYLSRLKIGTPCIGHQLCFRFQVHHAPPALILHKSQLVSRVICYFLRQWFMQHRNAFVVSTEREGETRVFLV